MKTKFFLPLIFTSLSLTAQYNSAGTFAFSYGAQSINTAAFKQFYTGAPTLNSTAFSWGGYVNRHYKNFIFGVSGAGIFGEEAETGGYSFYTSGGYVTYDVGYKIINKNKWSLYPAGNIGLGGVNYQISSLQALPVGGESAVFNNARYNWGNLIYGASLRFERYFKLKDDCDSSRTGGLFGIEAGFLASPTNNNWRSAGRTTVLGAPDFAFNSWFVRLTLGVFSGK